MNNRFLFLIENAVKRYWDMPAFSDYNGSTYRYKDFAGRIEKIRIIFASAGVKKGDKIAVVGRNSSHWAMTFFGTLAHGAVIVPILHEFKPDNIHHIVNHSESKFLFADPAIWENLEIEKMLDLDAVFSLADFSLIYVSSNPKIRGLSKILKNLDSLFNKKYPKNLSPKDIKYHYESPEELAVLNYTSGTTSFSKGVMLPYRSLWSNTKFANDKLDYIHPGDNVVCMLPMAHMYGLAFEILNSVSKGNHVHFLTRTPSPRIIIDAFTSIKPRLILAVPLIIEKVVRNKIFPELEKPLTKFLLKIPFLKNKILKVVKGKMDAAFGGQFVQVVIGGASLNNEVETFLNSIRFRYTIGYGMTECGPLISYEQWDTFKPGSCGRIVDRMEVKIQSEDPHRIVGEIYVRGMNVMHGYYKNEKATHAVLKRDGWMNTGDLGIIDKEGFLYIKGRSKTMILGPSGQNIYPEEIEDRLNNMPYVLESLIIQQDKKLVALVHPNWEIIDAEKKTHTEVESVIEENIKILNQSLPAYSQISKIQLFQEEFEKTPKRSIKRYLY